jgi:PEP-CTERM motif
MRHQAIKSTALMLGVLLLAAGPVQAGPIAYGDVVSMATVFGSQHGRTSVDLRLRSLSQQQGRGSAQQTPAPPATAQDGKTSSNGPSVGDTSGGGTPGSNVSLTGTEVAPQQTQTTVETIQVGEVDGTICDCGPILTPGGFPLWPLLGLAGIPLFFIPDDNPPDEVLIPPPPPPQIPEPASLLLLGTGLLAAAGGARRRRRQSQLLLDEREV